MESEFGQGEPSRVSYNRPESAFPVVHSLDEQRWRQFAERHDQSNIFHTPEMFQVFAQAQGHHPTLWATTDLDGQVLALLTPVQVTVVGGLLRRLTTRAVAYGSLLCDPSPIGRQALQCLLEAYVRTAKRQSIYTELRNLSDLSQHQPMLQNFGFDYADHLNYLIDLARPAEAIMKSMGRRTRQQIRRALRQGYVHIELVTTRQELAPWYAVLQKTYHHARVPLAERSLFEAAFDVLHPLGMIEFRVARVGDACAAVSAELLYKDMIYGWYGGTDRHYGHLCPNELLTWHILESGAQSGYKVYDFGGAGRPHEKYGVRDFKAKFGGDLVCFGRNTCVHSPLLFGLSTLGYRAYHHRLPVSASRRRFEPLENLQVRERK